MRRYAIPSASRIDALCGSRRLAFSSATVACAPRPGRWMEADGDGSSRVRRRELFRETADVAATKDGICRRYEERQRSPGVERTPHRVGGAEYLGLAHGMDLDGERGAVAGEPLHLFCQMAADEPDPPATGVGELAQERRKHGSAVDR